MDRIIITISEIRAFQLVYGGDLISTGDSTHRIIEAANEIILLAEQIKSERARAAINLNK